MGSIPRSMTVHLNAELTRSCTAGDDVVVSGIFLPVPYTGYRALRAGLLADTYVVGWLHSGSVYVETDRR